jgi:hypothetical protein
MRKALTILFIILLAVWVNLSRADSKADLHEKIDQCRVTSDPDCLRDILHRLVDLGGGGGDFLKITFYAWSFTCIDGKQGDPMEVYEQPGWYWRFM